MSMIDWHIYLKIWLQWGSLDIFSSCVDIKKQRTYPYTGLCGLGPEEGLLVGGLRLLRGPCLSFLDGMFPLEARRLDYYILRNILWHPVGKIVDPKLVRFPVVFAETKPRVLILSLGAEGVIPSRQIEGFLRDFKQFTHNIPSGKIVGFF